MYDVFKFNYDLAVAFFFVSCVSFGFSGADVFSKVVEGCVNGDETNSVHKANGFIVYRSRRSFNYAAQRGTWEPEGVSYHTEIQFFDYKLIEEES